MLSVLIVEDDELVRRSMLRQLRNEPIAVATAENAAEAIKALLAQNFDVMFLDYDLGMGNTGAKVAEFLEKLPVHHRPRVYATSSDPDGVKRILEALAKIPVPGEAVEKSDLRRVIRDRQERAV